MQPNLPKLKSRTASLIRKHLLNQLSEAETTELEQWIDADPANKQLFLKTSALYTADLKTSKYTIRKPKVSLSNLLLIVGVILFTIGIIVRHANTTPANKTTERFPQLDYIFPDHKGSGITITENRELQFNQTPIKDMMEAIRNYYTVPVVYKGRLTAGSYSGTIHRTMSINKMIQTLRSVGVNVSYNGQEIIVDQ